MKATNLQVSIVVPVYNEAEHLAACLQAIAEQTVAPLEVIVVDNNSSDATVKVAESFAFVRLLQQPRQGVVFARDGGFNAARGAIIGRIDADTVLPADWVATVQSIFAQPEVDAVSGSIIYYDIPRRDVCARIELYFRQRIASGMGEEVFLQGANMAIRRSAWRRARANVCHTPGLHEDFDLAIHAQQSGASVIFDPRLKAGISLRRFDSQFVEFWHYAWLNPRTYASHGRHSQRHMYPVIWLVLVMYWPIKLFYRGYDQASDRWSWRKALVSAEAVRVNPATFLD